MEILNANYSVLIYSNKLDCKKTIKEYLQQGIKVFYLTSNENVFNQLSFEVKKLYKDMYYKYLNDKYLSFDSLIIKDGEMNSTQKEKYQLLINNFKFFNHNQYDAVHSISSDDLLIKASAGTGKTTVMIDRILFLVLVKNISLSQIGMITFTNDAENNMRDRLINEIMKRFSITNNIKYIQLLENLGQLNSFTIHSFSKEILKDISYSSGYGKNMSIRSFKYQKKNLILDLINDYLREENLNLQDHFQGIQLHTLKDITYEFWEKINRYGLSRKQIENLDWGDDNSVYNNYFKKIFRKLYVEYSTIKKSNNAIAINDIITETLKALKSEKINLQLFSDLKYLFVDEFQDTDLAQIEIVKELKKKFSINLFLVGDKKQSIYRFRGAQSSTFDMIENSIESLKSIELNINYRSSNTLMEATYNIYEKMFDDYKKNHAISNNKSDYRIFKHFNDSKKKNKIKQLIEKTETKEIVFLVRYNSEIHKIKKWCNELKIPCLVELDGGFYNKEAVIDFYYLIGAFLFPNITKYQFNFLNSPFSNVSLDEDLLFKNKLNGKQINKKIMEIFFNDRINKYLKMFRLYPVLEVIKTILSETDYRKNVEDKYFSDDFNENFINTKVKEYQMVLNQVLKNIQEQLTGEKLSLQMIFDFLKTQIQTNKDEGFNPREMKNSSRIRCMTIHKAKGLEFDCVIIPFTRHKFFKVNRNHLFLKYDEGLDKIIVSWKLINFSKNKKENKSNDFIHNFHYINGGKDSELIEVREEESRLLYVALTRAKRYLYIFEDQSNNKIDWGKIIGSDNNAKNN